MYEFLPVYITAPSACLVPKKPKEGTGCLRPEVNPHVGAGI